MPNETLGHILLAVFGVAVIVPLLGDALINGFRHQNWMPLQALGALAVSLTYVALFVAGVALSTVFAS